MENKDIDKLFKQTFEDAEHTVPPVIWQNIEDHLDKKVKKPVPFVFQAYHWVSYAAAILIVLGISFFIFKHEPAPKIAEQLPTKQDNTLDYATNRQESVHQENAADDTKMPESTSAKPFIIYTTTKAHQKSKDHKSMSRAIDTEERKELLLVSSPVPPSRTEISAESTIEFPQTDIPTAQITEIGPIKPLIVFEEEEESMYAVNDSPSQKESTVVTALLNKLSENIDLRSKKEVRFRSDDEGSILVDLINPLAKNRNKKRK